MHGYSTDSNERRIVPLLLALSASGETEEILALLATTKRLQVPLITMTGDEICEDRGRRDSRPSNTRGRTASFVAAEANSKSKALGGGAHSTLAAAADVALDCSVAQEACSLGLAPTASTTTMLALGDALAVALSERRGFKEEDFANLHPGGKLGKRLARVESLMHTGDALPRVAPSTRMPDVIYEMSRKKLGVTAVVEGEQLVGIISDGDLRRLLENRGKDVMDLTAGEAMTRSPKTMGEEWPLPGMATFQAMLSVALHLVGATASSDRPSPCGPRQAGQSTLAPYAAGVIAADRRMRAISR